MKKFIKTKINSDSSYTLQAPVRVIKHRLVKTDPTYKFLIKAQVTVNPIAAVRVNSNNEEYYDLRNVVAPRTAQSLTYWINTVSDLIGVPLSLGGDYVSSALPPLFFQNEVERDLFDDIYNSLVESNPQEGVSKFIDFAIFPSRGFVANKLALNNIRDEFFTQGISLNILSLISSKTSNLSNFTIEQKYIDLYEYNTDERYLLSEMFKYNSSLFPQYKYSNQLSVNYFWDILNRYSSLSTGGRLSLFGFDINWLQTEQLEVDGKKISYNKNNLPDNTDNYKQVKTFQLTEDQKEILRVNRVGQYKTNNIYFK